MKRGINTNIKHWVITPHKSNPLSRGFGLAVQKAALGRDILLSFKEVVCFYEEIDIQIDPHNKDYWHISAILTYYGARVKNNYYVTEDEHIAF